MAKKHPAKKAGARKKPPAAGTSVRLHRSAVHPVQVKHVDVPPKYIKPKRIHPRRVLPLIREGAERGFHSSTLPTALRRSFALAGAPGAEVGEVVLLTNTALTSPGTQQTASNVGEPSVAVNGQVVVYSGNWYSAVSTDGGATFKFIDPATAFQASDPPNSSFCCDQVIHYIAKIDTFVWLLQYGNPEQSDNIQRLAFAKTADVAAGRWRLFDITTKMLGVSGAFLDFPDLATGDNALYVTTNIFPQGTGAGSAVVRIPFDGIGSGQVAAKTFVSMSLQSFRVAQNCGATAFFAAHEDTSTLALFSWNEGDDQPNQKSVAVSRWIGGNGYQSRTPDGHRWLDRADPRITGATLAGNELWFAWSVDAGSNQRPKPFVQIAKIDARNLTILDNINIFDSNSAIAYAALSTNLDDEVGISYMIGGGPLFPSHVVGILTGTRRDVVVASGERGPLDDPSNGKGEWGDYLTVRRTFPNEKLFAATGYTMIGPGDGSNRDVTPRFVVFGRAEDAVAAHPPVDTGLAVSPAGTSPDVTPPPAVQDVNKMPVVSASVAAQIKVEAGVGLGRAVVGALALDQPELATKPGKERWPVKTGTDPDVGNVQPKIVPSTVEEMITIPRPSDMAIPTEEFPAFQARRATPVETTIWRLDVMIIALKQEADGDYHLVLQGASGETMIGEIPTPRPPFVATSSPWLANIKAARAAVDDKLLRHISPAAFVAVSGKLIPRESLTIQPEATPNLPASLTTPEAGPAGVAFKTRITPTKARITGVGFFDKVHGQMGVSQSNGIELHPVLKIEWL
jgi:hypothetical protein